MAGYRGWLWTVGCRSFGENDRHPAVLEALESMVEDVYTNRKSSRAKEIVCDRKNTEARSTNIECEFCRVVYLEVPDRCHCLR